MPRPKPIATRVTCAASLVVFLVGHTDHLRPHQLAALILVCGLLPAVGVWMDWLRLQRPSIDDAFFAGAAIVGALAVGLAPSAVTALWHPVLLAVALTFALRRRVIAGSIVDIAPSHLTLALEQGRLRVARDAHEALGDRTALSLEKGAPLALVTHLGTERRGAGPFRSAEVLSHGAIAAVGATSGELQRQRRSHLRLALGMVAVSAMLGWGVALMHTMTIGKALPYAAPCALP